MDLRFLVSLDNVITPQTVLTFNVNESSATMIV